MVFADGQVVHVQGEPSEFVEGISFPPTADTHTARKGSDCTGTAVSALSCIASELHSNRIPATAVQEWYLLLENQWSGAVERAKMVGEKEKHVQLVPLTSIRERAGWHMPPAS